MKNMRKMMKEVRMQAEMARIQEELETKTVESYLWRRVVQVVVNGHLEVKRSRSNLV